MLNYGFDYFECEQVSVWLLHVNHLITDKTHGLIRQPCLRKCNLAVIGFSMLVCITLNILLYFFLLLIKRKINDPEQW